MAVKPVGSAFATNLATELGREIRRTRQALRWTQRELAVRAGVSQSTVSRVERGLVANFDLEVVGRIVDVLGMRVRLTAELPILLGQPRQRDVGHSAGIGYIARHLRGSESQVATEMEVGEGRYRGWIDILAWHAARPPARQAAAGREPARRRRDADGASGRWLPRRMGGARDGTANRRGSRPD